MKVYAFDVDETLECSPSNPGPVTIDMLVELRQQGHILGLCGNWAGVVQRVQEWHNLFSFIGQIGITKHEFLIQLRMYIPAEEFIMVGNDHSRSRGPYSSYSSPNDAAYAQAAGWRFINEDDFANGIR